MKVKPYGFWDSPLDPVSIFKQPSPPVLPAYCNGDIYWLEARAAEGGRIVLMRKNPNADDAKCLTPKGFNIRTQVHEYGGACHCFANNHVYFVNYPDQRVYAQSLEPDATPKAITTESGKHKTMFAALTPLPDSPWLVCVCEREVEGGENQNTIVALRTDKPNAESVTLVTGADFYASLAINTTGNKLAFMQWQHPNMPWDESTACMTEISLGNDNAAVSPPKIISPKSECAVCHLVFGRDDYLYFAMDGEGLDNFWNIYCYDGKALRPVTSEQAEFGSPHWVFGNKRIVATGAQKLVAIRTMHEGDVICSVDTAKKSVHVLQSAFDQFEQLSVASDGQRVLAIASSSVAEPCLVEIAVNELTLRQVTKQPASLETQDISEAQPIAYKTRDSGEAYAYFYPPKNSAFNANEGELPPLIVLVHGGPTSRTDATLNLLRQYWTGSGFALIDVNHRGSTGYGRAYRQALRGQWGVIDVDDIADGVRYVTEQGWADKNKVFIRGGSAGGYAVLRALTVYPQTFSGGACYYGIGNLQTLQELTHKFESRYTDGLVGEGYDPALASKPESVYQQRSPINFIDQIACPLILFQGDQDKVVPPELSREMAHSLAERKVPYEYVEYEGEGHGFRKSETRVDALEKEVAFYRSVLGSR